MTQTHVLWKHPTKHTDHIVSPLVVNDRMLLIKAGGIATCFEVAEGKPSLALSGSTMRADYFASPVSGDGKIYVASENGKIRRAERCTRNSKSWLSMTWATPSLERLRSRTVPCLSVRENLCCEFSRDRFSFVAAVRYKAVGFPVLILPIHHDSDPFSMRKSKTLARIRNNQTVRMCCLGHYMPFFVKQAAHFGFDCIWLDLEHRNFSDRDVQALLACSHLHDIDIMVRPATLEKTRLYRYLEDGAAGLMIPHVNTAEKARMLVDAVKFPPLGDRGLDGAGLDADFYVGDADAFVKQANEADIPCGADRNAAKPFEM